MSIIVRPLVIKSRADSIKLKRVESPLQFSLEDLLRLARTSSTGRDRRSLKDLSVNQGSLVKTRLPDLMLLSEALAGILGDG